MNRLTQPQNTKRKQHPVAVAFACFVLLTMQGCIPNLRAPKPGPGLAPEFVLPEKFKGEAPIENSSMLGAVEFFNDPILASLIDQGLANNQQLRILAEDIAIANNEIMRRRGAYLPFLSFGSRASIEKPSLFTPFGAADDQLTFPGGGHFPTPLPDFMVAGDISWQIDIWRQLRNARDAQGLRYLGTIDGWNYVVTRMVADIADNYYQLMALDNQLTTLNRTIELQERSLEMAKVLMRGGRGTQLGVQRFQAEVRKNQSQKLIIRQQLIEGENRINFLCGRYPQPVERVSAGFLDLKLRALAVGLPAQLLANRPDIRQAERNLQAAGLDVRVERANFYPRLIISAGVGWEAFNTKYLFDTPESLIYNAAGNLVAPLINRNAIRADYLNANASQLQALYDYQRIILNAFTEVVNRVNKVQNYSTSIELKRQQLASLEAAVTVSSNLFQNARVEYLDVLTAQRDRNDARLILIDTKQEQLTAIVDAYQALGGGWRYNMIGPMTVPPPAGGPPIQMLPAQAPAGNGAGPNGPGANNGAANPPNAGAAPMDPAAGQSPLYSPPPLPRAEEVPMPGGTGPAQGGAPGAPAAVPLTPMPPLPATTPMPQFGSPARGAPR